MGAIPPVQSAPPMAASKFPSVDTHDYSRHDRSVSAVSIGFVATAVLISVFLIVAILERFLRRPAIPRVVNRDRDSDVGLSPAAEFPVKYEDTIPEEKYRAGFSVLMPGEKVPTYIANPVPMPRSREGIPWPTHSHGDVGSCSFDIRIQQNLPIKSDHEEDGTMLV